MEIDSLEIRKVDNDTELAEKLLDFVENFSWEEVKEHSAAGNIPVDIDHICFRRIPRAQNKPKADRLCQ